MPHVTRNDFSVFQVITFRMIQANLYSVCPSISWCHLNFCQRLSLRVFDFHIPNLHQVHWGPEHDLWKSSVSVVSSQFRKCSLAGRSNWRGTVIRSMVEATENKETQLNSNLIQGHSRPSDTEFWRQRRMSSRPWQSGDWHWVHWPCAYLCMQEIQH